MIHTKLTERYGIELPFVSAGMGFFAVPPLAAAVSNAGGLGQLATGVAPPEILCKLISATRTLTDCPFAVNLIIETTAFGPLATDAHLGVCIEERVPANCGPCDCRNCTS
jgi:enoyl-[acyl-carrier protein] reductase II